MDPAGKLESEIRTLILTSVRYPQKDGWSPTVSVQSTPANGSFLEFLEMFSIGFAGIYLSMVSSLDDSSAIDAQTASDLFRSYFLEAVDRGFVHERT